MSGVSGPSEALTVLRKKKSAVFDPAVTPASQRVPPASCPRTPATADASRTAPPNLGVNPPGKRSWKEKQSGSAKTRSRGGRVGHVVRDGHRGTVRRAFAPRGAHVADEQGPAAVVAEHAAAGVRVAPVEEADHLLARVVRVAVELHAVAEQVAEVGEELEVVVDLRRTPDLGRVADGGVAGGGERRRVAALGAAAGGVGVAVLHAEVDEPGPAERQAGVAGDRVRAAVARAERAAAELEAAAGPVVLEQDVHHAGDRVRAVLRRGAVAQDLDLAQRDRRDGREVRPWAPSCMP